MPIIERHDYINSFHHVYLRGLDRHVIFFDDQDRYKFLSCLRCAQKKYGFKIHAYCLMDNHYHLYLQSIRGNLSRAMQSINMRYALYHNLKRERNGAVFESRFNSKLVQSEKYSLNIIRYIHRNPLEAKITSKLEDYYWSSYPIYLGKREPDEFFHSSYITNQVDSNSFIQEFQAFHHLDDEGYDFFDGETVYGDEEFIKRALEPAIVKSYSEFDHNEWVDSQLVELLYEAIYTRIDLSKRECLWLYVYALQDLTSLNYQEIVDLVDAPNKGALKQMNYRFKKGHLSTEKFASIYNGLRLIKDNVNTKRYGVTTRSE